MKHGKFHPLMAAILMSAVGTSEATGMSATGGGTAAPETPEAAPATPKEAIYVKISNHVKEKTGKRIGKTGGRVLFDIVIEEVFAAAAADPAGFRFNGGMGSLHVKTYQAGTRRLPNGTETTFGERQKMRYEEGVVVNELVQAGGDLAKVKAARAAGGAAAETTDATKTADAAADKSLD